MAQTPITQIDDNHRQRDRRSPLDWIRWLDDALYKTEKSLVTAALLVMSAIVFLDVWYRFLTAQRGIWMRINSGDGSYTEYIPLLVVLVFFFFLLRSIFNASPALKDIKPLPTVFASGLLVFLILLSAAMLVLPSKVVIGFVALLGGLGLFHGLLATPTPISEPLVPGWKKSGMVFAGLGTLFGLYAASLLPLGYSWAQHIALFLMLWMAFLGASMATHEGRHLAVDAFRKLIPESKLPLYNALSKGIAGGFTVILVWLSWNYLQLRIGQSPSPGEIPQWIKALAIPISLGLVSLRFFGQAAADLVRVFQGPKAAEAK